MVATTPVRGASLVATVNQATVTFDVDMLAASVANAANYKLRNVTNSAEIEIGAVAYDPARRTAQLEFEALPKDTYELVVASGVKSSNEVSLEEPYTSRFVILEDLTADVSAEFSNTRLNRLDGTVLFDAVVTNSLAFGISAPVRLVFEGLAETGVTLVNPDGYTAEGHPYADLLATPGSMLAPGESTPARTLSVINARPCAWTSTRGCSQAWSPTSGRSSPPRRVIRPRRGRCTSMQPRVWTPTAPRCPTCW